MMKGESIPKGIVRGGLWPDHHAALIELLDQHPSRRIGNHLMLNIAEACIDRWPITVADYNQAIEGGATFKPVKFTLRQDLYPRLFNRYRSLSTSIRTTVFLNMLNRFAEMARLRPEEVTAAMHDLEQTRNAQPVIDSGPSTLESPTPTTSFNAAPSPEPAPLKANHEQANEEEDVDPLSKLVTGL